MGIINATHFIFVIASERTAFNSDPIIRAAAATPVPLTSVLNAGIDIPSNNALIEITARSSIKVKLDFLCFIFLSDSQYSKLVVRHPPHFVPLPGGD